MKRKATREALLEALQKLFQQGNLSPSQDSLVEIVGGSKATIGRMMQENKTEIDRLRLEVIAQPSKVREASLFFGEQVWMASEAERQLKESADATRFRRILDDTHSKLDEQLKLNMMLAEAFEQQEEQLADIKLELAHARSELARLQTSESELRHRADAAEASVRAKSDLVAMLREIGIRPAAETEAHGGPHVDAAKPVDPTSHGDDGKVAAEGEATGQGVSDQLDLEDYAVVTGSTDRADDG